MPEIQIADIEAELDKLWEARGNLIRASLFNLVVYSQDPSRIPFLNEVIQATVDKFPSRILFIQCDMTPGAKNLEVIVSDELKGIGNTSIACDLLVIKASQDQLHRVPFIVIPHLIPDLPLYLLWDHNPTLEKVILPHLQPFANRLIFDSDWVDNLKEFSSEMLALMDAQPSLEVMDINWVRSHDWRDAMRQVFNSEARRQHLSMNCGIQIQYNNSSLKKIRHPELQSLYFAGWLAAQLQWKETGRRCEKGEWLLNFTKEGHEFTVKISPQNSEQFSPGTIVQVDVLGPNDSSFFISPVANTPKVVVHISSQETCELPFTLSMATFKKDFPFIAELMFDYTSPHYKNMLKLIAVSTIS